MISNNKLTNFINQAKLKYGDRYDYKFITEINSTSKLKFYCPEHDKIFYSLKDNFLKRDTLPCEECQRVQRQAGVVELFKSIHGDKYDYSLVNYVNNKKHVDIICPKHNIMFSMTPEKHIHRKQGCKQCGIESNANRQRFDLDTLIKQFEEAHGDKYDYSLVEYKGIHENIKIICPVHGEFEQSPNSHKRGFGCKDCRTDLLRDDLDSMIAKLPEEFKSYDFSKALYKDSVTKIIVICNECGEEFEQIPRSLIQGHGCKACSFKNKADRARLKPEEILERAFTLHNGKYEYGSLEGYENNTFLWKIKCPVHDWFDQTVVAHLRGNGCRDCAREASTSKREQELVEYLKSFNIEVYQTYRPFWMDGEEIDIFIPSINLGIEYNGGAYHHSTFDTSVDFYNKTAKSSEYHLNKYLKCKKHGVDLVHTFDFECQEEWYDVLENLILSRGKCKISFDNICREYYPRKSVCLQVYGKTNISLL